MMERNMLKRCMATVLAIALLVTSANLSWALETAGIINSDGTITVTDAQIVADNYKEDLGLTDAEVAVLYNAGIVGNVHTIAVPDAEDNLVTVDSTTKEITAKDFEKDGYTWKAVSATVVYDGDTETVPVTDGKATYTYAGNDYSIDVTYEVAVNVDNQETLVNAPYYLAQGVNNLEGIANDASTGLWLMETIIPQMMAFVDGSLGDTLSEGAASNAIKSFNDQITKNGSMDLRVYMEGDDGYVYASSRLAYLFANGADVKACTKATYEGAKAIVEDTEIAAIIEKASAVPALAATVRNLNRAMTQIASLADALEPAYNDSWTALDVKLVKEISDYTSLDTVVYAAIGNSAAHTIATVKNPLVAATTTITCNVNRYNVTVNVNASVVPKNQPDDAALAALDTVSTTVTLPGDATTDQILEAVTASGIEDDALEAWKAYEVDTDNYKRTVSELPATLTADTVYTITYTPNEYTITMNYADAMEVPYGYNYTFAAPADPELAYDYKIGDVTYMQNEVYRVTGDVTITRTEGKARESLRLADVLATDDTYTLTSKETSILTNKAVISDVIKVRIPENKNELVSIDGQTVTGKSFDAGAEGLSWEPAVANVKKSNAVIETVTFTGNTAEFESTNYEAIDVEYHLVIKEGNDATVLALLNLPAILTAEAKDQKADMDQLLNPTLYDNLASINKTMLNAMSGTLADSKAAIDKILEEAYDDANGQFYLFGYLESYKSEGLAYYYSDNNYAKIKEQVVILAEQLEVIAKDPQLPTVLEDLGYGEYKDRIDEAVTRLNDLKEGFKAPNAAINANSTELDALVEALLAEGTVNTYAQANGLKKEVVLTKAADNAVTLAITVNVMKGNGEVASTKTETLTYVKGSEVGDTAATVAALEAALGVDKVHYKPVTEGTLPEGEDTIESNTTVTYTWSPKTYTVKIDGEEDIIFTYDNRKITLPLSPEAGKVYVYTIGSTVIDTDINSNTYTFTADEIDTLFGADNTLTITRESVDIYRRDLLAFVDAMNKALANGGAVDENGNLYVAFIPVEKGGNIELVLRVAPSTSITQDMIMNSLMGAVQEMLMSQYQYIAMDGEAFFADGKVSIQTMIDMVLGNDGFGTGTVLDVIDENGDINEMVLENAVVIGAENNAIAVAGKTINDVDLLGGKLLTTELTIGTSASTADYNVPLYITIEDFDTSADLLLTARNAVKKVENYVTVECADDTLNVTATLPDKAYAAVMAVMLLHDEAYLADINDVYVEDMLNYAYKAVEDVLKDEGVDATTIENTLAMIGQDYELSQYDAATAMAMKVVRHLLANVDLTTIESVNGAYAFEAAYPMPVLMAKVDSVESLKQTMKDLIKNTIAEAETDITLPVKLELTNVEKDYEAVVLDNTKAGLQKFTVSTDAAAAIANAGDSSIVILLNDVEGNVHFNNKAVIDLNGQTINGDLTSDATVMVVDHSVGTAGTVTGNVSGTFRVSAGNYTDVDGVTAMLPQGYEVVDGAVENRFYTIEKDAEGNYNVLLSADFMKLDQPTEWKILAVEMAVDVALNGYTAAMMTVDGTEVYNVQMNNLLSSYKQVGLGGMAGQLVECINCEGVTTLANSLLVDITDFAAMATAIESDKPVASYDVTTAAWDVKFSVEGEGDDNYIDGSIVACDTTTERTLSLAVVGTDEEKAELVDLCNKLAEVVIINELGATLNDITYADGNLTVDASADVDVTLDFSADNNYAIAMAIIMANGMEDNADMIAAINTALGEPQLLADLVAQLEAMTTAEIIASLKAARGVDFSTMTAKLGVTADDATALEEIYHDLLNVGYAVVGKLGIEGGSTTLGAYNTAYATYAGSKENWKKMDIALEVILCKEDPEVEPTATPEPTVEPTATPEPTVEPTPEPTPVVTETPSPEPTPVVTETPTPTPTPSPTPTPTPTPSPTPSPSPTPVVTETPSPSPTPVVTETPSPSPTPYPVLLGDVNLDGEVKADDALLLLKYIVKMTELNEQQLANADVDLDGKLEASDALAILHYVVKCIPEFPTDDVLYGDVDLDGTVEAEDALLALKYVVKLEELNHKQFIQGDVDGNSMLTATDALQILKYVVKLIDQFEVEKQ